MTAHRFTGRNVLRVVATTLLLLASACRTADGPGPSGAPRRGFIVLACNDVYRVEGVDGGARGGLARLRSLRARLERERGQVLLLHAGDFLYPSFPSRTFAGAQMVDVMNHLDGDETAFDPRMFVTFGNHEFDRRELSDAAGLDARIAESQFTWLGTNVAFAASADGASLVEDPHLIPRAVVEVAGVQVGIYSITTDVSRPAYVRSFQPPEDTARRAVAELRAAGAEVVVAITHLELSEDVKLLERLGDAGPDLVIGGHDHEGSETLAAGRFVLKADADLRTATVAEVSVEPGGRVKVAPRRVALDGDVEVDAKVASRASDWIRRHEEAFCVKASRPPGCLADVMGHTAVALEAEELRIRRFETNLGDWIADRMCDAFAEAGAVGAFVNSGSLRLNQDLPAGSEVTRRHVEELFAFPAPLRLVEIDGRTLTTVLERSVSDWTGNGWWLQVSGLAFRHDPASARVTDLTLLGPTGARPVQPDERLRLVTVDFLVNPKWGQDGYTMLRPEHVVDRGDGRPDLKVIVEDALRRAGPGGIAPIREGRICNPLAPGPCLAMAAPR